MDPDLCLDNHQLRDRLELTTARFESGRTDVYAIHNPTVQVLVSNKSGTDKEAIGKQISALPLTKNKNAELLGSRISNDWKNTQTGSYFSYK